MFNVQWYVVRRLEMMGYDEEEFEDAMAYKTRARIEMATPRTLKSVPWPRPSCAVQFQAYVLPQLKSINKQRCKQYAVLKTVLTVVAITVQVTSHKTKKLTLSIHHPHKQHQTPEIRSHQFQSNPRKQSKE